MHCALLWLNLFSFWLAKPWKLSSEGHNLFVAFFIPSSTTAEATKVMVLEELGVPMCITTYFSLGEMRDGMKLFSSENQPGPSLRKMRIPIPLLLLNRCVILGSSPNFSESALLNTLFLWDCQGLPEVLGIEQVHSKNDLGLLHLLVPSGNMSPSQTFNHCHDSLTLVWGEYLPK